MATMEQIQELVTRIQTMEVREQENVSREQALQGQVQQLTAIGYDTASWRDRVRAGTVDTRSLGKPEVFEG
eukprot:2034984-Amphidinium_carterae.1